MRKILYKKSIQKLFGLTALTALLFSSSCKKFTELQPVDALSDVTSFTTPANIELVAVGVYNAAAVGNYNGSAISAGRGYPFGAAAIEQDEMRGEDMVNLAAFYQITYQATYDPSTANNVYMWNNLFTLINEANILIDGVRTAVTSGVITQTVANQYEAEGRFLRALSYHELLIHFCRPYLDGNGSAAGVPYRDFAVNSASTVDKANAVGRGTVAEDYTKLLADLDYAETNLPVTRSSNNITRATSAAAIALKTRIKLHMGDYAGVITEGAKLGTSAASATYTSPIGGYKLTASPDGPFVSYSSNTESIFSIENSAASNGGVNGALPAIFGPADKGGRGLVATNPNLYNAAYWVTGDSRRTLLQVQNSTAGSKYVFNYKYRDYVNRSDWAPIIRYAEVLLNVAEAYSRTTSLDPRALSLLNAVRNRAVPTASQYTIANFTTQNNLTQAILNERRIEFAGEGRRWGDIHRLAKDAVFSTGGIPAKVLVGQLSGTGSNWDIVNRPVTAATFAAIPYDNFRFLWPLPATEVANNPALSTQQNPGY
ncbi:MAG: RagB/SusD family nutrient uptake outer membrane protein [Sphingobacteriaceae bacterium]|nr:MAG: RagB/SusD family nutrient uptake outer membrane protein [Sphingobacteriaceae bacterium]